MNLAALMLLMHPYELIIRIIYRRYQIPRRMNTKRGADETLATHDPARAPTGACAGTRARRGASARQLHRQSVQPARSWPRHRARALYRGYGRDTGVSGAPIHGQRRRWTGRRRRERGLFGAAIEHTAGRATADCEQRPNRPEGC